MKKNLRNILALSLGLMTTVAFAQDWNADSRTRINTSGENDLRQTDQRVTVGTTWGGSNWGLHVSSDVNYTLQGTNGTAADWSIYEAYASTDLMGYASLTAGRQALNYGSGALMSTNDWGTSRTTWDGMTFGLNLEMADVTVGWHSQNAGMAAVEADSAAGIEASDASQNNGNMWVNIGGEFSGWNVNLLYMTVETDGETGDAATGVDISGTVQGVGVTASMNSDYDGDDMRVIGLTYAVNDDMGVNVSQTVYGEAQENADGSMTDGFHMANTSMDNGTNAAYSSTGQLGYLGAGDEMLSYGLTYNMSGISLGATMHNITHYAPEGAVANESDATEISLGYSLNDNADLSLSMITHNNGSSGTEVSNKYTWLTLNIGL